MAGHIRQPVAAAAGILIIIGIISMIAAVPLRKSGLDSKLLKDALHYAAKPNNLLMNRAWATASPLATHRALPFRIILTASIPRNVRHAVRNDP